MQPGLTPTLPTETHGIRSGIIGIFLFLTSIRNSIASDLSPTPTGNIGTVPEITLLRISSYKYIKSILTHAYSAHFFSDRTIKKSFGTTNVFISKKAPSE